MSITKNSNRQMPLVAMLTIMAADLASGVDVNALELPGGAVITGGDVTVITPFNSATSDVLDVGDGVSQNRYLNDANIHVAGRTPLVPTGYVMPNIGDMTVRWTGVGTAPTAGEVRLTVEYVVEGRASTSQG